MTYLLWSGGYVTYLLLWSGGAVTYLLLWSGGAVSWPAVSCSGEAGQRCSSSPLRRHSLLPPGGRGAAVREGAKDHPLLPSLSPRGAAHPAGRGYTAEMAHRGEEEYVCVVCVCACLREGS